MLKMIEARIQSNSSRPRTARVDTLVLHYTALDLDKSLAALRRGAVSAHYVLAEDGTVYRILENDEVGFHAGLSTWRGKPRVNERSIGIEIVNLNGNVHAYPQVQVEALIGICRKVLAENPHIELRNVVGHSDVSPKRKVDPGILFPWKTLAEAGIGLWPDGASSEAVGGEPEIQALLESFGYPGPHAYGKTDSGFVYVPDLSNPPPGVSQVERVGTPDILRAFQLRFQPEHATGVPDNATLGLLRRLAALVG